MIVTVASLQENHSNASIEATAEERELVRRMRAGDERAFDEFADHYIPGIYRFAGSRLKGDRELTRDIVQSTVCKVIEKLDSYRGEAPLFVWLYACCRNEIAQHFRRAQSRPVFADVDDFTLDTAESALQEAADNPEVVLLENERGNLVHLALDHLPPRYASALEWKYLQGESVEEIGGRLGVSPKAAESLLTRARHAFQTIYSGLLEKKR